MMVIHSVGIDLDSNKGKIKSGNKNDPETEDSYTSERPPFEGMPSGWYAPGAMYLDEIPTPGPIEEQYIKDHPDAAHRMLPYSVFIDDTPGDDTYIDEPIETGTDQ